MKRITKRPLVRRKKKTNKKSQWLFLLLLPFMGLTVFAVMQPQIIKQFAATTFNSPPLFGCLQVGKGTSDSCGTKLGEAENTILTLHGRPYKGETVYYNDTLSAKASYKNIEEQPIAAKYLGIAGGQMAKQYYVEFSPLQENVTIPSGQTTAIPNASYTFRTPDADGQWIAGIGMTDNNDTMVPIKQEAAHFSVSPICTALRIKQLTNQDKNNIKALCSKDPNNKLCKSRQYCEIFKGAKCDQPNLGEPIPEQQCDEFVVLEQKEQDILEELCKVYPNTDACKKFCDRALNSSICPKRIIWVDNRTGKRVYPQKAKYLASINSNQAVAGASDSAVPSVKDTSANLGINTPFGCLGDCTTGDNPQINGWGVNTPLGCTGECGEVGILACSGGICIPDFWKPAPPNKPAANASTCPAGSHSLGATNGCAPNVPVGAKAKGVNPFPPKPKGTGPGQSMDPRNYKGYQPSCTSHRGNSQGQCCSSGYELINDCCQPGCFVYHSEPESRSNCEYKNKSGRCCSKGAVEQLGYCEAANVPPGKKTNTNTSRDPRIFPPGAIPVPPRAPAPAVNPVTKGCSSCPAGWVCGAPETGAHCVKSTPAGPAAPPPAAAPRNDTPQYPVPANCANASGGNCISCNNGYNLENGVCKELLRNKHQCSRPDQCASNYCGPFSHQCE